MDTSEANIKWNEFYGYHPITVKQTKVHFEELPQVRSLIHWSFAHREARRGPWIQAALDRARFHSHIQRVGEILEPILENGKYKDR